VEIRSHKDLVVWQKSMDLVEAVYAFSAKFPAAERFRMVDQICRAAISIPANIAEGHGRGTRKDYTHFISIARGSLAETETFLLLAERLGYGDRSSLTVTKELIAEIGKMLNTLRARLAMPRRQP
jgi:four helix bundle protein